MAELLIRASTSDAALVRRIYGLDGRDAAMARPSRIVVDAHAPVSSRGGDLITAVRRAGVPLLIDPQTFYWQGTQHANDPWAQLAFGRPAKLTPADVDASAQEELVAAVVGYQVANGATAIIPPYVHIDQLISGWIDVQAGLWRRTRKYLDRQHLRLPVTAVLALGWRVLDPVNGPDVLAPVLTALSGLGPTDIALAASKTDQGKRTADRVMDLILMIEWLRREYPIIAWQQGRLGEVAVAAGAIGYECGIAWRESCDLGTAANAHRAPAPTGPRAARPVFIPQLGRSIPKRSIEAIREHRDLWMRMLCHDTDCCPPGGTGLLADARAHAVIQRKKSLDQVSHILAPVWRWQRLATAADEGLDLAERINRRALNARAITPVNTGALAAISAVSHTRRADIRSRRVA